MKPTIYLLNSPVLPEFGCYQFEGPVNVAHAQEMVSNGFVSAIGHEASAVLLTQLLDRPVAMNRHQIELHPGDQALVLRLKDRLPEGRVLSLDELSAIPYELGILKRLS